MSSPLEQLAAAHAAKLQTIKCAEAAEQAAIRAARESGATLQAIGDVLGITRAGVLYRLNRDAVTP